VFQSPELIEIEDAQRLLIAKSDLQRNLLRAECVMLGQRLDWTQNLPGKLAGGSRWLMPVAALAGFLALRGGGRLFRWVPTALTAWRMVSPLLRFLR
jgi:hypothetical protein